MAELPSEEDSARSRRSGVAASLVVLIVAGTRVRRDRLARVLSDAGVHTIEAVRGPQETLTTLPNLRPHVVVLDLSVHAGGLEVVEQVMARHPVPIVLTGAAAVEPADALAAGAVDIVSPRVEEGGIAAFGQALVRHLLVASRVRVITHPRGRLRERGWAGVPSPEAAETSRSRVPPVVAIGASTGGPPALATVLRAFPATMPAAILVIQHMADGFVASLATWLDGLVGVEVRVARDLDRLTTGTAFVAPSESNLLVDSGGRIRLSPAPPSQLHIPGIDETFTSVARACGPRAVGVLLTGMGRDGAAGLGAMRAAGAFTIAQDEATSAVWGMPGAALAIDAASAELPLEDIGPGAVAALERHVNGRYPSRTFTAEVVP